MIETELSKLITAIEGLTKAIMAVDRQEPATAIATVPKPTAKPVVEKAIDQVPPPTTDGYTLTALKEMAKALSRAKALSAVVKIVADADIGRISECPPEKIQQVGEALKIAVDALPKE
jgi:predicted exporter